MSAKTERLVQDLTEAMKSANAKKTSAFDASAEVVRVEGDTAWVNFPGGASETPVKLTMNAKPGDEVQVRVTGGQAFLVGNATNPPTDDTTANRAKETAGAAQILALSAKGAADIAAIAAGNAIKSAEEADTAAKQAKEDAKTAYDSAKTATISANGALNGLSTVQNVVGTLNWITEHGRYKHVNETVIFPDKQYYKIVNPVYVLTTDTEIDSKKDYFTRSGTGAEEDPYIYTWVREPAAASISTYYVISSADFVPQTEPNVSDIDLYYDLIIDESIRNYLASHLAQDSYGLNLTSDDTDFRIHIGSLNSGGESGIYILNELGNVVGFYGKDTIVGNKTGPHISLGTDEDPNSDTYGQAVFGMWNGTDRVAYITNNELYITHATAINSFMIDKWEFVADELTDNLSLYWIG